MNFPINYSRPLMSLRSPFRSPSPAGFNLNRNKYINLGTNEFLSGLAGFGNDEEKNNYGRVSFNDFVMTEKEKENENSKREVNGNSDKSPSSKSYSDFKKFSANPSKETQQNNNNNNQMSNDTITPFFPLNQPKKRKESAYKCSCTKSRCEGKYCGCYSSGRYCIDCQCENCQNKPPKSPIEIVKRPCGEIKKNEFMCTCANSQCSKNYCECFKNGAKCGQNCRCISCKNGKIVVETNIIIEKVNNISYNQDKLFLEVIKNEENSKNSDKELCRKRKREEDNYFKKLKKKKNNENEENDETRNNSPLFDKNGRLILKHSYLMSKKFIDKLKI